MLPVLPGCCGEGTLLYSALSREPIEDVIMRPAPVQQPRIPVWVGGTWLRHGPARWDGSVLIVGNAWEQPPGPAVIAEMHFFFHARRTESGQVDGPFDLVAGGSTPGDRAKARDIVGPLADAGATWWDERFPISQLARSEAVYARIEQGPPCVS